MTEQDDGLCHCDLPVPVDGDTGLLECLVCLGVVLEVERPEQRARPPAPHVPPGKVR